MSDYTDYMEDQFFSRIASLEMEKQDNKIFVDKYQQKRNDYIWTCKDGTEIPVSQLSDKHLNNIINMIKRKEPLNKWLIVLNHEKKYRQTLEQEKELKDIKTVCLYVIKLKIKSTMDYEKKYKKALERMNSWAKGEHPECFGEAQKVAEFIFPELKESEDDKIKRCIGDVVRKYGVEFTTCTITKEKMLAWLEKQGKNANFINKIQVGDKVTRNEDGVLVNLSQLERVANENEKQEEQKTDKVKPKFKVGDWIVSKGLYPSLIVDIDFDNDKYEIEFINGNREFVTIDYVDIIYHLWTIEDAKDGDVLTTDTWTFIFKKCKDGGVYYHCAISTFNEFSTSDTDEFNSNYVNPATKEQRDLLFQKMEEAGYKWDTEKIKIVKKGFPADDLDAIESLYNDLKKL